jgi:CBS domain-containing protein
MAGRKKRDTEIMETVKDYMDDQIVWISSDASVTHASQKMTDNGVGSLIIKENTFYVGFLTEGDISRKVVAKQLSPDEVTVQEIMSKDIVAVESNSSMEEAFKQMSRRKIRHIAVTHGGIYVGILSIKDFATYYTNKYVDG